MLGTWYTDDYQFRGQHIQSSLVLYWTEKIDFSRLWEATGDTSGRVPEMRWIYISILAILVTELSLAQIFTRCL